MSDGTFQYTRLIVVSNHLYFVIIYEICIRQEWFICLVPYIQLDLLLCLWLCGKYVCTNNTCIHPWQFITLYKGFRMYKLCFQSWFDIWCLLTVSFCFVRSVKESKWCYLVVTVELLSSEASCYSHGVVDVCVVFTASIEWQHDGQVVRPWLLKNLPWF